MINISLNVPILMAHFRCLSLHCRFKRSLLAARMRSLCLVFMSAVAPLANPPLRVYFSHKHGVTLRNGTAVWM